MYKLALSALSLLGLAPQPEKPVTLASVLAPHIPVHDIQAIIAGYASSYSPLTKIDLPGTEYTFTADSRFLVSCDTNMGSNDKIVFSNSEMGFRGSAQIFDMHTRKKSAQISLPHVTLRDHAFKFIASSKSDVAILGGNETVHRFVMILDAKTGKIKKIIDNLFLSNRFEYEIRGSYSPDGRIFAITKGVSPDRPLQSVNVYETRNYTQIDCFWAGNIVQKIAFSSDGTYLLACTQEDEITIWNVKTVELVQQISWEQITKLPRSMRAFSKLALSDKNVIATDSYTTFVWDLQTNSCSTQFDFFKSGIAYEFASGDGTYIAAQKPADWGARKGDTQPVVVWDTLAGKQLATFECGTAELSFACGNSLLVAQTEDAVHLYDPKQGVCFDTIQDVNMQRKKSIGSPNYICKISPDGRYLAVECSEQPVTGSRWLQLYENYAIAFEQEAKARLALLAQKTAAEKSKKRKAADDIDKNSK